MMNVMRKIAKLTNLFEDAIEEYNKVYDQVYFDEINGFVEVYEPTKDEWEWLDSVEPEEVLNNTEEWINSSYEEKDLAVALYVRRIMRRHELKKMHYEKRYGGEYYVVAVGYGSFLRGQSQMMKRGQELLKKMFPNSWICY